MTQRKGSLVFALLLIGIGLWYLAAQLVPQAREIIYGANSWPYQIIGFAILLALVGLVAWVPGLLIPATIIGGIGALLYYQASTGDWKSWSYAWTLIPGFVGVGLLLFGVLTRRRGPIFGGLWNLFACLVLFGIFGWALGGLRIASIIWPAALILFGLLLLASPLLRGRRSL